MPDAHYCGLFLTRDATRALWRCARDLIGLSCAPPGCKSAADHVTLRYEPRAEALDDFLALARARRGRAIALRVTHASVSERSLAFIVSWDDVPTWVPTPECAQPHVSVFAGREEAWRTLGERCAMDAVSGEALDLSAVGWGGMTVECRFGVRFRDGTTYLGDEEEEDARGRGPAGLASPTKNAHSVARVADAPRRTSVRPEYAVMRKSSGGGKGSERDVERESRGDGECSMREERRRNGIRRQYLRLCAMFETLHPEEVKKVFIRRGFDMERTAQDLLTQLTRDTEDAYDNDDYADDYADDDDARDDVAGDWEYGRSEDEYEHFDDEEYEQSSWTSNVQTASSSPTYAGFEEDLMRKNVARPSQPRQQRVRKEKQMILQISGGGGNLRPNYGTVNTEVSTAARRLASLQGPNARSIRLKKKVKSARLGAWQEERLAELSAELSRLRLQRDRGDASVESTIQAKLSIRNAVASLGEIDDDDDDDDDQKSSERLDSQYEFKRVLDFHGYDRISAIHYLEKELVSMAPMLTSDWKIKLVTGRGRHSSGGRVIHGEVMRWLQRFGIAFEEGAGHIIVRASASIDGR